MNSRRRIKSIIKDNATIKKMTDSQHRAIGVLVIYELKLETHERTVLDEKRRIHRICKNFFLNSLPVMLHIASLPELDLTDCFADRVNACDLKNKIRNYLRYIDRKYGTWYESTEPLAAA